MVFTVHFRILHVCMYEFVFGSEGKNRYGTNILYRILIERYCREFRSNGWKLETVGMVECDNVWNLRCDVWNIGLHRSWYGSVGEEVNFHIGRCKKEMSARNSVSAFTNFWLKRLTKGQIQGDDFNWMFTEDEGLRSYQPNMVCIVRNCNRAAGTEAIYQIDDW